VAAATFFEHQHIARRNTRVMVMLFLLATLAVILAVDALAATVYLWATALRVPVNSPHPLLEAYARVPMHVYVWSSIATAALILVVSIVNAVKLSSGGEAVAEMVGARRVEPGTREPLERQLLNIVEEMSIAAGVRVPHVYVMDGERGINAFAAGWDTSNSVLTVTRGALETLSRDELQGVVAHEFSHIVNADIRLNIRMLGVLAGILFIGSIGQFLMRGRARSEGKGATQLFFLGLALFIVGYVGLFFARLIKAAVSREREYLADASSVQFTRNPDGIAGALDQIRAAPAGALVHGRYAEEISHMFFGQAIDVWAGTLFDTHPPIDERIRRVHPGFIAKSYRERRDASPPPAAELPEEAGIMALAAPSGRRVGDVGVSWGRSAGESAKLVGTLDAGKIDYAARLLAAIPAGLREAVRDADGARAAVIALLFAPKDEVMHGQLEALKNAGLGALAERAAAVAPLARDLGPAFHLPVVDLALPAIKSCSEQARNELVIGLKAVIDADRRVSLHEFVVLMLIRNQLAEPERPAASGRRIADLAGEVRIVLSLIAHAGIRTDATGSRAEALAAAMRAGTHELGLAEQPVASRLSLDEVSAALAALKRLAPLEKARLVKGLFAAVIVDGTIRVIEAELMRLLGAVLDCPLPPLLDSLDPATLAA
jgi:Zn-dependent protease with chaperone function